MRLGPALGFGAVLALAAAGACSRCPDALPPEQFCFVWPLVDSPAAPPGPCPAPDGASLFLQAGGTDARGAVIEDPFEVLGPGGAVPGRCCYVVQQTPPCP